MYCHSCGNSVQVAARFCPSCGTPLSAGSVATLESAPPPHAVGVRGPKRRGGRWITAVLFGVVLLFVGLAAVGALVQHSSSSASTQTQSGPREGRGSSVTKQMFTRSNWALLQTDPDAQKGARVDIVGKVFIAPQRDANGTYWQMYADPKNSEWNTIVAIRDPNFSIQEDAYVHVVGIVKGTFDGTNAFGAKLTVPSIIANQATVVDATAARSPAVRAVALDQTQTQNQVAITVTKVEFASDETRAFITVSNGSRSNANFYDFDAKAVQGSAQYSAGSFSDYPEVQSNLLPGVSSSGVVVFKPMNPQSDTSFVFGAGSDNYDLTFQPYRFSVSGAAGSSVQGVSAAKAPAPAHGTAASHPSTGSSTSSGFTATARSVIKAHGYTPFKSYVTTTQGAQLSAWQAVCTSSADGNCAKAFFFVGDRYIGTDTAKPSLAIVGVGATGPSTIAVTYAHFLPNDPLCCPSGAPVKVSYTWTGSKLVASGAPPPNPMG